MKIIYCMASVHSPGGMERVLLNKVRYLWEQGGNELTIVTTDQGKRHYASLWRKPGQILLQMSNLTWEKADVTATLDLKALGLKGKFTNAITGESVPCIDGKITLNIPDYDCRLIIGE